MNSTIYNSSILFNIQWYIPIYVILCEAWLFGFLWKYGKWMCSCRRLSYERDHLKKIGGLQQFWYLRSDPRVAPFGKERRLVNLKKKNKKNSFGSQTDGISLGYLVELECRWRKSFTMWLITEIWKESWSKNPFIYDFLRWFNNVRCTLFLAHSELNYCICMECACQYQRTLEFLLNAMG